MIELPKQSACPANSNGYGPHEAGADSVVMTNSHSKIVVCKRCAALFAEANPPPKLVTP